MRTPPLFTERLELRPITLPIALAALEGRPRSEIEAMVGAEMPWTWPSRALVEQVFQASPDDVRADPETRLWGDRLLVTREAPPKVVGSVVFHGRPDADGVCAIAYGIEEMSQGKGYATEALSAVIAWALSQAECRVIRAATTTWHKGSLHVLEKVGMRLAEERDDPDAGKMLVYEIRRPEA
jgi:[ribosomal protein S5]-alanine N-acetyltransferase